MSRVECRVEVAVFQVAIDLKPRDSRAQNVGRLNAKLPHHLARFLTEHFCDFQIVGDAADDLATVAPAGAPGHAAGFQQRDAIATIRQLDRRVNPGKTTTDNAHVGTLLAGQRGG